MQAKLLKNTIQVYNMYSKEQKDRVLVIGQLRRARINHPDSRAHHALGVWGF